MTLPRDLLLVRSALNNAQDKSAERDQSIAVARRTVQELIVESDQLAALLRALPTTTTAAEREVEAWLGQIETEKRGARAFLEAIGPAPKGER